MLRRRAREGWTLAELLVTLGVIALLAGLLLPASTTVLRYARRVACAGNLRQVALCVHAYAGDWDGLLPAEGNLGIKEAAKSPAWFDRLPPYVDERDVRGRSIFQCPAFRWSGPQVFDHASPKSYKMNAYLDEAGRPRHYRLGSARREGEVVLFVDAVAGETGMGQWGHCLASAVSDERHRGAVNVLALDGRTVSAVPRSPQGWAKGLRWLPEGWAGGPKD
ncbi:MAG: DUF1559 domain-containing protein [Burkholderiaceae bacterium]|nr:DUF1559 domain-containing protein [Burkholderiaceae bacterium]